MEVDIIFINIELNNMPDIKQSNWEEKLINILNAWANPDDRQYLINELNPFIKDLLVEQEHDHEILINTLLETKNEELAERDKQWLNCLPEQRKYETLSHVDETEFVATASYNVCLNDFITNAKKFNLIK